MTGASATDTDQGSATVWVLSACVLVVSIGLACVVAVAAVVGRHRAQAAADLAALAGARYAALGEAAACAAAGAVVDANGARVTACRLDGLDLVVSVAVEVPGAPAALGPARATARAGPAGIPGAAPPDGGIRARPGQPGRRPARRRWPD
ncbi:MAG TPA: Rv3654c family TadE-like protein [Micromonosporaceae bacterium]|nr:Rv3654c family TadE-like protein [Micromonosporaceae bacterium]